MASTAARTTSSMRRVAERGDGGAGGPCWTNSSVIDLANNRLTLKFILRDVLEQYGSKILAGHGLHLRHGYRDGGCQGKVRLNEGEQDDAAAVGRDAEIGACGLARLERGQRARGDRQDL